jgi:hypothetical protein
MQLYKYPRTHHLNGSRIQPGDEDLDSVPWSALTGRYLVVEEKLDGANSGISFEAAGKLWLQSRGHFLAGGPREKHFDPFKQWANTHAAGLRDRLGTRYVLYGEWLYAKHTVYYDALPAYFLEFDVLDTHGDFFLATDARRELLDGLPVESVPVVWRGEFAGDAQHVLRQLGPSLYKSSQWRERLTDSARRRGLDLDQVWRETDGSDLMEGLYVKDEEAGRVAGRYKYIRASFLTAVTDSGGHWLRRPILPNGLADAGGPPEGPS